MTSADQPPDPLRRENSPPDPSTGGSQAPQGSDQPGSPSNGAPFGPGYEQPPGSPYGSGQADPRFGASYPSMPPYGQQQPYASGPVYGDSPYEATPYQDSFGGDSPYEATPYQASFGGSSPYGMSTYSTPPVQHPQATLALILGILGLAVCPFVGIGALVIGNKARKQIDAAPGQFTGRGMATTGFVLGIVSVALIVLFLLVVILGLAGALGG